MKMAKNLKNFNLFVDGLNQYGVVVDITRPKIVAKIEEYTPGGGFIPLGVKHGYEKLEMEITSKGYDADLLREMASTINGRLLRYQGALQHEDEEQYIMLKGEARGRIIEADPGTDKQGEGGEHKFKLLLTYWKETVNGEPVLEIDAIANKAVFGGKDEREGLRGALGL